MGLLGHGVISPLQPVRYEAQPLAHLQQSRILYYNGAGLQHPRVRKPRGAGNPKEVLGVQRPRDTFAPQHLVLPNLGSKPAVAVDVPKEELPTLPQNPGNL